MIPSEVFYCKSEATLYKYFDIHFYLKIKSSIEIYLLKTFKVIIVLTKVSGNAFNIFKTNIGYFAISSKKSIPDINYLDISRHK